MKQALIVHGSGGHPSEIWFPWLKEKLERDDYEVIAPAFPSTPETQTLENWLKEMKKYPLSEDCIAIGHSLGCAFILNLLEQQKFRAVYLVAGFVGLLNNEFDSVIQTFSHRSFEWEAIRKNAAHFDVLYSDNDPYVSSDKCLELAEKLKTTPTLIPGAGHFNSASGYFEFEELRRLIRGELF